MARTERKTAADLSTGDTFMMMTDAGKSVHVEVLSKPVTFVAPKTGRVGVEFDARIRDRGVYTRTAVGLWANESIRTSRKSSAMSAL